MRLLVRTLASILLVLALTVPAQAQVAPSAGCTIGTLTGERVFCEPLESATFLQFEHFEHGLHALEESFPEMIHLKTIGTSIEGRPIYFVEVTNEESLVPREEKLQLGYSASIHANEAAGREGMARMVEDLVRGIGPHGADLQPLLDHLIVNVWFPNPDSWASGDYFEAGAIAAVHPCDRGPVPLLGGPSVGYCSGFDRENANGTDLNRQFPNPGIIHTDHAPMTEPETRAVVQELRFSGNHSNLVAGMDLHGMLNSQNMVRAIIPNQDYDLRRMVLAVDMLRTMQERIEADPAFAEWKGMSDLLQDVEGLDLPLCPEDPTGLLDPGCLAPGSAHGPPMAWGARWDMIGYTDTGFTSDYLMLSPRSPTGGMGAIGTITEFAYSHVLPDNKYVAKLTDMHVAGVRQMVRTQMELALRLESPMLTGTGTVGYAWTPETVSSKDDPFAYRPDAPAFDRDDASTWFDFRQVPYEVSNLDFWADLDRFTTDLVQPVDVSDGLTTTELADLDDFVLTDQTYDALSEQDLAVLRAWVEDGGHLLVTDSALRFFEGLGMTAQQVDTYLGYTDVQDWSHPLVEGVDWDARVTGEGPAIGIQVGRHYPQWTVAVPPGTEGFDVVGTTEGAASLGRLQLGAGTVDLLGGALPMPVQEHAPCANQCTGVDHRYGLAGYSVSAFTYWIVANSLGGSLEWQPLDAPFVPTYDFDPLHQPASPPDAGSASTPSPLWVALAALALAAVVRAPRPPRP